MKFIEKVYRRFCADEVKLMLDHMEDNYADFESVLNHWSDIVDSNEYTAVERAAINLARKRLRKDAKRQRLLADILTQKLNPKQSRREEIEQGRKYASALHSKILAGQQNMYNNQLAQYAQQQHQQHIQTHEEYARQQANMLYGKQP
jgi:hypothetical protein